MTDRIPIRQLERLTLVYSGSEGKTPTMRIVGRSAGVAPEHIVECRRAAPLAPPSAEERANGMPVSLGIFRGESIDYVITRATVGPNNILVAQYMLATAGTLRWLGGNLRMLEAWAHESFGQGQLPAYLLQGQGAPDAETQTNDLLALIDYCRGSLKTVNGLLAGLVQGMGLSILHAPSSLRDRLAFVQGLLTLLPAPARVAITFATTVIDPAQTNTQIKFLASDAPLERHLRFDWQTGALLDTAPDDAYTKFIMAQLRLDTSLVVEQTEKLARTAVWRAMRRENMASALAWAAKRASLDELVITGGAADLSQVAAVLREDPTLPDHLRVDYARHLMTLSLKLGDFSHTDMIPAMALQNNELASAVYEQLWNASGENPEHVYSVVERWITGAPQGMDTSRWRPLLEASARARVAGLLTSDNNELIAFLNSFRNAAPSLGVEGFIGAALNPMRKRAYDNSEVAQAVLLVALTHLPLATLQRIMADAQFTARLPLALRQLLPYLQTEGPRPAPPNVLVRAADSFGPDEQLLLLSRLVEWAFQSQRLDLVDAEALRGMVRVAVSPQGEQYDSLIEGLVHNLSQLATLKPLAPDAQRYLIELCIARGHADAAVTLIALYNDALYSGTHGDKLGEMVRQVFRETPVRMQDCLQALETVYNSQLRPLVCVKAFIGALEGYRWAPEMESAARRLTDLYANDPRLIAITTVEPAMNLLRMNAERRDSIEALRTATGILTYALTFGEARTDLVDQTYALITWNTEVSAGALQLLRDYVRRAAPEHAAQMPRVLGEKYGDTVRRALDATYRLRQVLGGSDFATFAEAVQAALVLIDMAIYYRNERDLPPIFKLRRSMESMPGGMTEPERRRLADNLLMLIDQIMKLAERHASRYARRSRADVDTRRNAILQARTAPATALEMLTWLGAHIGQGRTYPLRLEREAPAFLLGQRSVNTFLAETDKMVKLFAGLLDAFPENGPALDQAALLSETVNVWELLSIYKQNELQSALAENLQALAQVIQVIGEKGHDKILGQTGPGRQLHIGKAQPKSVLEAMRWLSGYLTAEHVT